MDLLYRTGNNVEVLISDSLRDEVYTTDSSNDDSLSSASSLVSSAAAIVKYWWQYATNE